MEELEMAKPLLTDEYWETHPALTAAGAAQAQRGAAACRIAKPLRAFCLCCGADALGHLPEEMGCGCGMTCWRRLRRLAFGGRLGQGLVPVPRRVGPGRRNRLVQGGGRQLLGAGGFGGVGRVQIPRIAARTGRSGTSSAMARGSVGDQHTGANVHDSQPAIPLIDSIRPSSVPAAVVVAVPKNCSPTGATTPKKKSARPCVIAHRAIHCETWNGTR